MIRHAFLLKCFNLTIKPESRKKENPEKLKWEKKLNGIWGKKLSRFHRALHKMLKLCLLILTRFLYHYFPVKGLLLILKQCFEQIACCFSDSVPLPSFPMLHRSTTLGRPPGHYYRKLVESIVGAVSFPDTLTISCIVLADRYWTKYAKCHATLRK